MSTATLKYVFLCSPLVFLNQNSAYLCHIEPQSDGLSLLKERAELPGVKHIIKVAPQAFQNVLRELHLFIVPP